MLPFYHPTTLVALDDDPLFLESFSFHFGDDFLCETFTRPDQALRFVDEAAKHRTSGDEFFSADTGIIDSVGIAPGDGVIKLQASVFARLLGNNARFRQVSVVVVDYAMPGMNGVEFCRQLKGHPVRKILLTGKASEETAVQAFNEGVIDCFLMKQMADLPNVLEQEIREQQRKYFAAIAGPLQLALALHGGSFASDDALAAHFLEIFEARSVTEYYWSADPAGMIVIDELGKPMIFAVADADAMSAHLEIARAENAPAELLAMLEARSIMPFFPTEHRSYTDRFSATWREYIWPIQSVHGESKWHCSLIDNGLEGHPIAAGVTTYAAFRDSIDA